jgi:hypothetical protein
MTKLDLGTFIQGTREDFKIAIEDLFNVIELIRKDVEKLKTDKNKLI